jgi:aminopeptidase N
LHKHSHNFTLYCRENGWTKYEFEETQDMSTYLVAFIVSDFNSADSKTKYDFTAWARPNAIDNAAYSQDVGPRLVEYFEDYTGINYTFPKIDQVALPDFSAGAMENWGLITYRYVLIPSCHLLVSMCSLCSHLNAPRSQRNSGHHET